MEAAATLLREELREAVAAERFLVARSELLPGQRLVAVRAREAFAVERRVLVRDSTFVYHLLRT